MNARRRSALEGLPPSEPSCRGIRGLGSLTARRGYVSLAVSPPDLVSASRRLGAACSGSRLPCALRGQARPRDISSDAHMSYVLARGLHCSFAARAGPTANPGRWASVDPVLVILLRRDRGASSTTGSMMASIRSGQAFCWASHGACAWPASGWRASLTHVELRPLQRLLRWRSLHRS